MTLDSPTLTTETKTKMWASTEEVKASQSNIEHSQKMREINNVLQVLDFPDNQEEAFRKVLNNQNFNTLQHLATQSKREILIFLISENKKAVKNSDVATVEREEWIYQVKETTRTNTKLSKIDTKLSKIDTKLSKIKSLFTHDILENNPDIAEKFEILDGVDEPLEKDKILQEILQILKEPWKLKAIIDGLGGADRSNPHYVEFKTVLLGLDSGFTGYFDDLENIHKGTSLATEEVVGSIEWDSWWVIDIDLAANPPLSKMSLIGSEYSFDKELDTKALTELQTESKEVLGAVQESFALLEGLYKPFDVLLNQIRGIWWKPHFWASLKKLVGAFSKEIFSDLAEMYDDMGIKKESHIKEADIDRLAQSHSVAELKQNIETIKTKFTEIKEQLWNKKESLLTDYKAKLKNLVQRDSVEQKRELEVLEFMHSSGFDLFPKELSNRIIGQLKSGMLVIPNLPLGVKNIDLHKGNFGESSVFIDKGKGLNIEAKRNLVKFVNKMISWKIDEPLVVESIANGMSVIDPLELKNTFLSSGIKNTLGWKYNKILENLRTK